MEKLLEAIEKERRKDQLVVVFSSKLVVYDSRKRVLPLMDLLNEKGVSWLVSPGVKEEWVLCKVKERSEVEV